MKRHGKYVGIMVGNRQQRKRVLQTRQKFTNHIQVFSFMPSSIRWKTKTVVGLQYTKHGYRLKVFPFPKVVYNRYYQAGKKLTQRIEKVIGRKCFNHVNHFNKQEIYDLLSQTEVAPYLPHTEPYHEPQFNELLDHYKILYLKPTMGNKGKGVYRFELMETGEIQVSQHHFSPFLIVRDRTQLNQELGKLLGKLLGKKRYLVQQGISNLQLNGRNFDLRVLVQKDGSGQWSVTNLISRIAHSGYFNTSINEAAIPTEKVLPDVIPSDAIPEMIDTLKNVSLHTAALIEQVGGYHLGELSVDFVIDNNYQIWLIEINGDPIRTIYKGLASYPDVYRKPIQYAKYLLRK